MVLTPSSADIRSTTIHSSPSKLPRACGRHPCSVVVILPRQNLHIALCFRNSRSSSVYTPPHVVASCHESATTREVPAGAEEALPDQVLQTGADGLVCQDHLVSPSESSDCCAAEKRGSKSCLLRDRVESSSLKRSQTPSDWCSAFHIHHFLNNGMCLLLDS
jgi:hypothetical protein